MFDEYGFSGESESSPLSVADSGAVPGASVATAASVRPVIPAQRAATDSVSADRADAPIERDQAARLLHRFDVIDAVVDAVLAAVAGCPEEVAFALVERLERMAARMQALMIRAQVRLAQVRPLSAEDDGPYSKYVDDEIAALLGQSPRTAADRLARYWDIADRVPAALAAMAAGDLDYSRLLALAEATAPLSDEQTARVEEQMLAGRRLASPSAWRRKANRLVHRADPTAAARRRAQARRNRTVWVCPLPDGMAQLSADLPAEDARAIMDRIDRIARADAAVGTDTRTIGARRADVLTGLLLGNRREYVTTEIQVVVGAGTLLGLGEEPAELAGYGPIPAELARQLAGDATWRRILTDPVSGVVLDAGARRFPPPALARFVRARTVACTFPGCPVPAIRSDLDHTVAHARGGPTRHDNLGPACAHHHALKHRAGWALTQPRPGIFEWTSPAGRVYLTNGDDENPPEPAPSSDHRQTSRPGDFCPF